jgi:hypothetical protein
MKQRVIFMLLAAFWVVMNILLWRAEYGAKEYVGAAVSPQQIWEKVLTAADASTLEIFHKGKRIGAARWVASIGEAHKGSSSGTDESPEGMVRKISGYTLDFDGNLGVEGLGGNLRFYLHLVMNERQEWKDMNLRLGVKPIAVEVHANAANESLELSWQDGMTEWKRNWKFAELKDPLKLIEEFDAAGMLGAWVGAMLPAKAPTNTVAVSVGMDWKAHHDILRIGGTDVRVYRLEVRLFGNYRAVMIISRAGEIMRVELPGDVTMINYALTTY